MNITSFCPVPISLRENTLRHIENNSLEFSYPNGDAILPQENRHELIGVIASAIITGPTKAIYHLAKATFYGVPKASFGEFEYCSVNMCHFARDMEEVVAGITMIFHDKLGSDLVRDSQFQSQCYSYFEKEVLPLLAFDAAEKVTLGTFFSNEPYSTKHHSSKI
jgi:hypothetical protein